MAFTRWDLRYLLGRAPWDRKEPPAELVELVESGRIPPGRALDLGCGTGTLLAYLASRGFEVWGVDLSAVAVWKARWKLLRQGRRGRLYAGDIHKFRPDVSFDLVTDVGCYHAQPPERRAAYPELLSRLLKPGGDFLLWVRGDRGGGSEGPNPISKEEIETNFLRKGFSLQEFREIPMKRWTGFFFWLRRMPGGVSDGQRP